MKCPGLLFVCWCSSILVVTSCIRVDGYSCVTSYWKTITCVLNIPVHPVDQANTTYSLKFRGNDQTTICPLVLNQSYSCVCEVAQINLSHYMEYSIELCNESGCTLLNRTFDPSQNIQLTPPSGVEVQQTPENFNITWKSGYENHRYFAKSCLDYELLLQKYKGSWNKTLISTEKTVTIPRSQFDAHATYCIAVRSKPSKNNDYNGIWSKWSPMACFKKDVPEEEENTPVILTKFLGAVCSVAVVLLFVFYSPATRMRIKALSHTPSPASFFQPLYQQHGGVFQKWLSPQGKSVQTYKTEDIMITNTVTVVPKPITKDPEENQDFHNPSVTPLVFSQCQTSYVGLPGMHVVSHPITLVCPRDTSYTQLPTSVLGFSIGEVKAVSPPPEDSLEISHTDSGCSCEDLTQSPECSLPSSPVVASSPPCYCTDYCILNKTAEGVVPVLVSK